MINKAKTRWFEHEQWRSHGGEGWMLEPWASAAGGPWLPTWVFKHGTNIVDRGLKVLFIGLFLLFFGHFFVAFPLLEEAK